jgi:hypothetical protein
VKKIRSLRSFPSEVVYGEVLRNISRISKEDIIDIINKIKEITKIKFLYLKATKETLLDRRKDDVKDYPMIQRHYDKLTEKYDEIFQFLEHIGCEVKTFDSDKTSIGDIFKNSTDFYSKILFCGNLSRDCIIDENGNSNQMEHGGSAFNSAFVASMEQMQPRDVAIFSVVGNDYDIKKLNSFGINTDLIKIEEKQPTISFYIGEKTCETRGEYLQYSFPQNKDIYAEHLHISCRGGVPDARIFVENITHKTLSIDIMCYAIDTKFLEIDNVLEKNKPDFLFCNKEEY